MGDYLCGNEHYPYKECKACKRIDAAFDSINEERKKNNNRAKSKNNNGRCKRCGEKPCDYYLCKRLP